MTNLYLIHFSIVVTLVLTSHRIQALAEKSHTPCRTSHAMRHLPVHGFEVQADSDGIARSQGCRTTDGYPCSMCCNGKCCERLSDHAGAVRFEENEQLWIPLRFNLLLPTTGGTEWVNRGMLQFQIDALNSNFASSNAPFRFTFHSLNIIRDTRAYQGCNTDQCYITESCDFYTYTMPLVRGANGQAGNSEELINVMLCDSFTHYDGEAQYPWASVENHNHQYLTMQKSAFGNFSASTSVNGEAKTMVHEMGHYLGLLHTFEPGRNVCGAEGDFVADTPTSKSAVSRTQACDAVQDTCPGLPGNDDRNNFMNYAQDLCRTEFTPGQVERMEMAVSLYRPKLRANTRVVGLGGNCPTSGTFSLDDCRCPIAYEDAQCTASTWCRNTCNGSDPSSTCSTSVSVDGCADSASVGSPKATLFNTGVDSLKPQILFFIVVAVVVLLF